MLGGRRVFRPGRGGLDPAIGASHDGCGRNAALMVEGAVQIPEQARSLVLRLCLGCSFRRINRQLATTTVNPRRRERLSLFVSIARLVVPLRL